MEQPGEIWSPREKEVTGKIATPCVAGKVLLLQVYDWLDLLRPYLPTAVRFFTRGRHFPFKCEAKLWADVQIRALIQENNFSNAMDDNDRLNSTKIASENLTQNSLVKKLLYYEENEWSIGIIYNSGMQNGCEIYSYQSHIADFPENLGKVNENKVMFLRDIKIRLSKYEGRWNTLMLADKCLKQDSTANVANFRMTNIH